MWLHRTSYMILLIILSTQMTTCYKKGSLTYVIDNTLSMTDDIDQVKRNTDEITNIVFQQKASVIKNMVLVTVNDPYAFLEIATENRYELKSKINGLHVHNDYGNPDCPEMSMTGILIALENSLPRSFIYVFTDASAKDYSKSTEVKKKCQEKQSQIVFILTGDCWDFPETQFQVYYDIAAACPGLAIYIEKSDVAAIFEPIKDAIKDNKEMITSRTFPARTTVDIPFELTEDIEYATVTASGSTVTLSVRSEPAHNEQRLSWINNLKVLRLTNITPGTYTATVYSTSVTTINIFGRSDFSFEHGFSGLEPKNLQDTLSHPIENISTQLFVSVTDANHTVNILFLQILDMNEHVISTYDLPLKRISGDFYSTPSFIPPSSIFKIAVCGKAVNTGKKIKRLGRFPITPQKADKYLAPKLTGETSISALVGTSTNIKCVITDGVPAPIISWQFRAKDKLEFVPLAGSNNELSISKVSEGDAGSYKCIARNIVGNAEHITVLIVQEPPTITSNTATIYKSIEGKDKELRLPCSTTGLPKPTITWSMNQKTIQQSTKYLIEDGNLVIKNPSFADTSTYKCTAKNDVGSVSASFQTEILHIPVITSDSSYIYKSIEGQDQELRIPCKATGIPKPIITWTRKQETLKNSAKYFIDNGDLVINDPTVDDTSTYICTATNEVGPVSASFQAEILRKPVITSDTSVIYKSIEAKDKVLRLPCKATGPPKPTITWTLQQETIKPSTKYTYEDGDLIINNPTRDDTSTYTCIAKNEAGSISASFQVQILRVPVITSDSRSVYYSIEDQDTVLKIPCRATGIPIPRITWSTNGQTIKPRSKHNFVDGHLLIRNPTVSDTATYVCTATNEAGSVSASFQAEIRQKPQISGENIQTVRVTTPTSIKCLITKGVPMPTIAWEFMAKDKSNYVRLAGSENVFHISQVAVKDSGYYKCIASNIAGRAEHTTTLVVQVPPIITTDDSKPFTIVEGREEILKIPCAATGFPQPTLKWITTNGPIIPNAKYDFKDGDLTIQNPSVSDTATYFCVATNDAGKDSAIFHAVINQAPQISGDTSKLVELGTYANISCTIVKGVPIPTITWFKAKIGSKYVRIPNSGTVLLIPSVREEDMGRYKCIAHNVVGDATHITTLLIKSVPKITNNPTEPYKGLEGDVALSIPCNAIGVPPPQISWFVNGTKITANSHHTISRGALIIKDPTMIDTGSYKCEATNSMGSTQAAFDVYVKENLDDYGDIEVLKINVLKQSTYKLECASPGQSVRWFVDKEDIASKGNYLELKYFDYDANYTCRVSDIHGAFTKTYRVLFGEAPKFQFDPENDPYDWNGSNNDKLDCRVDSENDTRVEWTYNGEKLSDHTSLMLGVGGKWGQYTCNVSNGFGDIQRSFNVISSHCYVPSNPNEYTAMPLILTEQLNWPTFEYTENYFQLNPGDKITFVCSKYGKDRNNFKILPALNEITAICEKQDTLIVNGQPFKPSDLGCDHDFLPTVINQHKRCDKVFTEGIQVGYDVSGFLESYKVCFDTSINMPLYSSVIMPNSYESVDLNKKWYRHPAIKYRTDDSVYTCKNSILRCCYSKTQLVSPSELPKGPAQSSTFIDTINAVPLWHPCDKPKSPWKEIEERLSVQLPISPAEIIWSGIHTIQYNNGHLIPRYLFKLVKFIDDDPIAIIYVNGPSPTAADILCKNICANGDIFWLEGLGSDVYCCHGDDFRVHFNFNHYV